MLIVGFATSQEFSQFIFIALYWLYLNSWSKRYELNLYCAYIETKKKTHLPSKSQELLNARSASFP